jgi:hypothetical protein
MMFVCLSSLFWRFGTNWWRRWWCHLRPLSRALVKSLSSFSEFNLALTLSKASWPPFESQSFTQFPQYIQPQPIPLFQNQSHTNGDLQVVTFFHCMCVLRVLPK